MWRKITDERLGGHEVAIAQAAQRLLIPYDYTFPLLKSERLGVYMIVDSEAVTPINHEDSDESYRGRLIDVSKRALSELRSALKKQDSLKGKVGVVLSCPCCYKGVNDEIQYGNYTTLVSPIPGLKVSGVDRIYIPNNLEGDIVKDFVQATIDDVVSKTLIS